MEDNNNNLGDFFRKNLSSSEEGDQDWFNPDPRTDDLVVQGLIASSRNKKNRKRWVLWFLPFLLFLGMSAYIVHLKHEIALLGDAKAENKTSIPSVNLNSNSTNLEQVTRPTTATKTPGHTSKSLTVTTTNKPNLENQKIEALLSKLQSENRRLKVLMTEQDKKIQTLEFDLSQKCNKLVNFAEINPRQKVGAGPSLFSGLNYPSILTNKGSISLSSNNLFRKDSVPNFLFTTPIAEKEVEGNKALKDLLVLKSGLLAAKFPPIAPPTGDSSFSLKKHKKRRLNSFEIGFQGGVQVLLTGKGIDILNQRIIANERSPESLVVPYFGANIAYSPIKNLWIRTGLQMGGSTDYKTKKIGVVYDKTEEYQLPSGDIGSDFVLNTSTGYTSGQNTLKLIVPNTTIDGDLFELEYHQELKTQHLQVPLSAEYFFGENKWQFFVHFGAKWSLFRYEYKISEISILSKDQAIDFSFDGSPLNVKTVQYMSLMTGVGFNWNLKPKLSVRTTLGIESNFLLNETTATNYTKDGFFVNFGLYYKF